MIYISQLHGPRSHATGFLDPETFFSCFLVTVPQVGKFQWGPLVSETARGPFQRAGSPSSPPLAPDCWFSLIGLSLYSLWRMIISSPRPPNYGPKSECLAASKVMPVLNGTSIGFWYSTPWGRYLPNRADSGLFTNDLGSWGRAGDLILWNRRLSYICIHGIGALFSPRPGSGDCTNGVVRNTVVKIWV